VRFPDDSVGGHWRDYGLDVVDLFRTSFAEIESIDLYSFDRAPGGLSHAIHRGEPAFVLRKPLTRSH
jgi:hypothetical protein